MPGRTGILVAGRVVDGGHAGTAADGHQGQPGSGDAGLDGQRQFDRAEDACPRTWSEAYVDFVAGEMRLWLHAMDLRWFPIVGWAERSGSYATGHGNSVPRFHLTWGTGPGVMHHFERRVREHVSAGRITLKFRRQVDHIA